MKQAKSSEEQIVAILREQEAARRADVCQRHGDSRATFYPGRPGTVEWTSRTRSR